MKAMNLIEIGQQIVAHLVYENDVPVVEATIHRPPRSRNWVATFTGLEGGQVWKSTGLSDRTQALLIARKWEAEARAQRIRNSFSGKDRAKRTSTRLDVGEPLLTQRDVALLLGMSERGVRAVERRAMRKLRQHPVLRKTWEQFLSGELE